MSEKRVNKRIRKLLEQDLAEAVAEVLRAEAHSGLSKNVDQEAVKSLEKIAEQKAQTLGRFEASVRRGPPPPTSVPGPGVAKWGAG